MDVKNRQFLSKGSFGTVYLDKNKDIISKYVYIYDSSKTYIENNIREVFFHCLVTFGFFYNIPKGIPRIKSLSFRDNYCVINMPYYGVNFSNIQFSSNTTKYIYDLLTCLNFLHNNNLSHGDLKPANILVKNDSLSPSKKSSNASVIII
jgi:serine/threonine protein kinase